MAQVCQPPPVSKVAQVAAVVPVEVVVPVKEATPQPEKKTEKKTVLYKDPDIEKKERRGHRSHEEQLFGNVKDALTQFDTAHKIPLTSEILESVANHMPVDEIGRVIAEGIKKGRPTDQHRFTQQLIKMLMKNETDNPELEAEDVMRMADDQILAMLESDFGVKKRGHR